MKTRAKLRTVDLLDLDEDGDDITTPGPTPLATTSGRRLGQYLMFEEIARGETGALHLGCALGPDTPRPVTIKHLYPWLAANASYADAYLREVRLAARIRHPNVARMLDVVTGLANGELYLVMDYVPGDTLAHLLSQTRRQHRGGPPPAIVAGVMAGLLRGLNAVQEATLAEDFPAQGAQREVSPQDVIVGLDGVTRIFEFGAINPAHGHMRELVSGRGADVFSAGAMLWEILAGHRLFGDPTDRDVFLTSATNLAPPPSHFNPAVTPELDAVVLRALRKDRDRRFASADAFADAIEAAVTPATAHQIGDWVARTSTHLLAARAGRVAGITQVAPALAPPLPPPSAHQAVSGLRRPGRRNAAAIAVALTAALIGAGLWARTGEDRRAIPRPTPPPVSAVVKPPAPAQANTVDDDLAVANALADADALVVVPTAAPTPAPWHRRHARVRSARPSLARIAGLNEAAINAYGRLDPSTARRRLRAALAECARAGLGHHPIAARSHALLGVVLAGGFRQPELGAEQFRTALRIDPGVPLPSRYASETDVAAAFRAAVATGDLHVR